MSTTNYFFQIFLFFAYLFFSSETFAQNLSCLRNIKPDETYFTSKSLCDANGNLREQIHYFPNSKSIGERWTFDENQKLVSYMSFNREGEVIFNESFVHLQNDIYNVFQNQKLVAKNIITLFPKLERVKTEAYFYKNHELFFAENYEDSNMETFPSQIRIYENNKVKWNYQLTYRKNERGIVLVTKFKLFDGKSNLLGEYDEFAPARQDGVKKPNHVAIIDSGFDLNHPQLTSFFAANLPGLYNDPAVDRINVEAIQDSVILSPTRRPPFPFSHGTHVASVAMRDTQKTQFTGFAGDFSQPDFLNTISLKIKKHNIKIVNMSFGFGERSNPFGASEEGRYALFKLMNENPQTLFIVAAGNDASEVLENSDSDWPAGAPVPNKIVVAATNQSAFKNDPNLKLASFSNFGNLVDIAAPGDDVMGANIGNVEVRMSGTSMAAPNLMNIAIKILEINPNLSMQQLKDILLTSVYVPTNKLAVRTQGVLDPSVALQKARETLYSKN